MRIVYTAKPGGGRVQTLGRYEIVRELGRGGFATVFEAWMKGPLGFRTPVALKILDRFDGDAEFEEARRGGTLQHPNVVATYSVEVLDGRPAIAMELVRGTTARQLSNLEALSVRATVELGVQASHGLAYIHQRGWVHRDVKPDNLLIDRSGWVKVTDLGMARATGSAQTLAGTFGYMPVEQCEGAATPLSDIFGLGVTLHRVHTRLPLFGSGRMALVHAADADAYLAKHDKLAAIEHPGLREVVRQAIRTRAEDRFESMEAFQQALMALLDGSLAGPSLRERLQDLAPLDELIPPDPSVRDEGELIGRDGLLEQLQGAVSRGGVLIHGPVGIGKSALAGAWSRSVDAVVLDAFIHRDTAGLVQALAAQLGRALGRREGQEAWRSLWSGRTGWLVLDGVEHVEGVEELLGALIADGVQLLVTSQTRFQVGLEVLEVPPLQALQAARLFAARGGGEASRRQLRQWDGVPLVIELAAARSRQGGGTLVVDGLQAALRATWSALPRWAPAALARLCAFEGGFHLRSATAVLEGLGVGAPEVLETLHHFALLAAEPAGHRYRLPRPIRGFAVAQDAFAAGVGRVQHGLWFGQYGTREGLLAISHVDQGELRREVQADLREFIVASERARQAGDADLAHGSALVAARVFLDQGPVPAGERLLEQVAELEGLRQVDVLVRLSYFKFLSGRDEEATELARRAKRCAVQHGDPHGAAQADLRLGQCLVRLGRNDDAVRILRRSLAAFTALNDPTYRANVLYQLAAIYGRTGEAPTQRAMMQSCAVLFDASGVLGSAAAAYVTLGILETDAGEDQAALQSLQKARRLCLLVGNHRRAIASEVLSAEVRMRCGELEVAEQELLAVRKRVEALGDPLQLGRWWVVFGQVAAARKQAGPALERLARGIEHLEPIEADEARCAQLWWALVAHEVHPVEAGVALDGVIEALSEGRWANECAIARSARAVWTRSAIELAHAERLIAGREVHPLVSRAVEQA